MIEDVRTAQKVYCVHAISQSFAFICAHGRFVSLYDVIELFIGAENAKFDVSLTLLTKADVCERLQVSERTIENLVKANEFPPPVRIGKRVYWTEFSIKRWQHDVFAAQESWTMY